MRVTLLVIAILLTTFSGWSQNKVTQGANKIFTIRMNIGEPAGATYLWALTPSVGTSTDLALIDGNSAGILWDGPVGLYSLSVQATDGNGSLSEPVSQQIEIITPGDLILASDFPHTIVCSDLAGNAEGSVPGHSESLFRVTYAGDANLVSAILTIENPNGEYIGFDGTVLPNQQNPEVSANNIDTDKVIDFTVTDSWENNTTGNMEFKVKLISVKTSDNSIVVADKTADVERTITVLPKPAIEFQ